MHDRGRGGVIPQWSCGLLNPKERINVPGSVLLLVEDHPNNSRASHEREIPTQKTTDDGTIILDPQADDSLNDPLNWPRWHKYNVPVTEVSLTTGLIMLGLGVGCVLVSPTAIIYGKRPVYLGSAVLFLLTTVWCALSPSFSSLLIARVVQGIAVSPIEAVPSASIAEIFFLHERAFRIGIYSLMFLGGKILVPLVSAAIINDLRWRWAFWVMAIAVGFVRLLLFLFSHETFWDRNVFQSPPLPSPTRESFDRAFQRDVIEIGEMEEKTSEETNDPLDLTESALPAVAAMFEEAERATTGSEDPGNEDKWLQVACRPFLLFAYPAILWSAAVYSCCISWLVVISESMDIIYRSSGQYHFTALQTGLVYVSPFIGGVLGSAVAGKVSDIIVRAMARRNVMAIPVTVCTVMGLMGFGRSAQNMDLWIVPTVFFGIISFGCALGSTTAITYCVDSCRQFTGEALVTLKFSKNIFYGLVFSLFITKWLQRERSKEVYIWIEVIKLVLLLITIPMFVYGKRARLWTSQQTFHQIVTSGR
ncbi:major facilitator superfamily domain-containing protein [Podospora fimiseda]|uniref:Major facilitator superfamily domain-containing protein n=1 Tax=Podospora fimiseda TaxID=252190 RepID=A0AAN7BGI8_9PEZI|nr:major facilitator superfamily domain-containing protein [Podospora fimiseda]